ncbi:MAG: hypothetical protein DDT19_02376 [Syntrophomonadaceae bacterium]|nr:hypothetical protein [Bacillota bacterium]
MISDISRRERLRRWGVSDTTVPQLDPDAARRERLRRWGVPDTAIPQPDSLVGDASRRERLQRWGVPDDAVVVDPPAATTQKPLLRRVKLFARRFGEKGADALLMRDAREQYTTTGSPAWDAIAGISGQIAGSIPSIALAYKTAGLAKLPQIVRSSKLATSLLRGAGAGAVHGTATELMDTDKPLSKRIGGIPRRALKSAAAFAAGDVVATGLGLAARKGLRYLKSPLRKLPEESIPAGGVVPTQKGRIKKKKKKLPEEGTPQRVLLDDTGINITAMPTKDWKDGGAFGLGREIQERNIEKIAGKDAAELNRIFFTPVHTNVARRTRWLDQIFDEIRGLGIKAFTKEARYLQQYGEKLISEEELMRVSPKNWQKIKHAAGVFRQIYDRTLDDLNVVLARNGFDPIPKRQNYFTHFTELADKFDAFGIPRLLRETSPSDISGIARNLRPGKTFFASELPREGTETVFDAIRGIERYMEGASKVLFLTDDIQRLRKFEAALRSEAPHLKNYIANLSKYTDHLAGKKHDFDIAVEGVIGEAAFNALDVTRRRTGANMIGYNVSVALTQFIPLTQALATMSTKAMSKAGKDIIANVFRNDGFINQSDFLTRRYGYDPLSLTFWEKGHKAGYWLLRTIDQFVAQIVVRSKYYDEIAKGLNPKEAMAIADDWAMRMIADRSIGSMPNLFESRSLGVLTQFMLEINNQVSFVLKDIPATSETKGALASAIGQLFLYSWLFNNGIERITGGRPAPDPIGVTLQAIRDFTDPNVSRETAVRNIMWGIGRQIPFFGMFAESGRIPIGAGIPDVPALLRGERTLVEEVVKPLTFLASPIGGGAQVARTIRGIRAALEGGVIRDGKLRHPVTPSPGLFIFGPGSTPEGREYRREGRRPLTEEQTEQWRQMGGEKQAYDRIIFRRALDSIERQIREIMNDQEMDSQTKVDKIRELRRRRNQLLQQ